MTATVVAVAAILLVALLLAVARHKQATQPQQTHPPGSDDKLLRAVSHDLRSPLGTILGAADLIDSSDRNESTARWTAMIRAASMQLSFMIDDLVWCADEHRGRLRLGAAQIVNPLSVAEDAASEVRLTAAGRAAAITVRAPEPLPQLLTYRLLLTQLLVNLIENACAQDDNATVDVVLTHDNGNVRVTVEDNGNGMGVADFERLSKFGVRAQDAAGNGLGLGLTAASGIAQRLDATLQVGQDQGVGRYPSLVLPAVVKFSECPILSLGLNEVVSNRLMVEALDRGRSIIEAQDRVQAHQVLAQQSVAVVVVGPLVADIAELVQEAGPATIVIWNDHPGEVSDEPGAYLRLGHEASSKEIQAMLATALRQGVAR